VIAPGVPSATRGPRPVEGRDRVLRFLIGLIGKYAMNDVQLLEANSAPAARMVMGDKNSSWRSTSGAA
jgi:hypothetical protein